MATVVALAMINKRAHLEVRLAMFRLIFVLLILLSPAHSNSGTHEVTIRGIVRIGSTDSGITDLNPDCGFLTNSDIAERIFTVCGFLDECEVHGTVDENDMLLSISRLRKIDTNIEPSVDIITDAAYWALGVKSKIQSRTLCTNPLQVSNIHSYIRNDELFWMYNFKLIGFECGTYAPREIGSGSVSMVKRGDTWYYYR